MGVSAAEGGRVGVRLSGRPAVGQAGQRLRLLLREADEYVIAGSGEVGLAEMTGLLPKRN